MACSSGAVPARHRRYNVGCRACVAAGAARRAVKSGRNGHPVLLDDDSRLPGSWIAMLMEYCDDVHRLMAHAKVHGIRKPAEQRPSNLIPDLRKLKWTVDHPLQHRLDFIGKLVAESGPLVLVPRNRIGHVDFGLWPDNEASCHALGLRLRSSARSSSRSSSQDLPAWGLPRFSARRSSITSRCQSGTGTASGFAAMRSQRD